MRHGDLFSGIGGFALAAQWAWGEEYDNVFHSEIDEYAEKVYHKRFPRSKCLGDIREVRWEQGQCDLLTGGFPCQPHSVAGERKGSGDERDLWGECVRALRGIRPRYALFENVPGIITSERGKTWAKIALDLEAGGYEGLPLLFAANEIGALHIRKRIWIVARRKAVGHTEGKRWSGMGDTENERKADREKHTFDNAGEMFSNSTDERIIGRERESRDDADKSESGRDKRSGSDDGSKDIPNTNSESRTASRRAWQWRTEPCNRGWWETEPAVGRVVDGLPNRVERLRVLGNAIVPQVAWVIFEAIKQYDKGNGN
jgi:DNA (cytosine-5)-methyltransferase 1